MIDGDAALARAVNGVNINLRLAPWAVVGAQRARRMQTLIEGTVASASCKWGSTCSTTTVWLRIYP